MIIDISKPLEENTAVFPGDVPFSRQTTMSLARGDSCNVSAFTASAHAGTHVDLPRHFSEVDTLPPLDAFVGPAIVINASKWEDVEKLIIPSGLRVLFKTTNSRNAHTVFDEGFSCVTAGVVRWLSDNGTVLVGVDGPSVDPADSKTLDNHHTLWQAGVAILENLDLSGVDPGEYELIALPLRIPSADATWVRAILRQ
ncbi:MAG: cyclase family protein [Armatimonadetes bacterium]|nr:cyclase family protein [Armatimonadota bacterium]